MHVIRSSCYVMVLPTLVGSGCPQPPLRLKIWLKFDFPLALIIVESTEKLPRLAKVLGRSLLCTLYFTCTYIHVV